MCGLLLRRRMPDRNGSMIADGRLGEVSLRSRVGGATELVVASPGYRQVICEATPAIVDLFAATLRCAQPDRLETFAAEGHALRVAATGTRTEATGTRTDQIRRDQ
jgi:hypothetical protein